MTRMQTGSLRQRLLSGGAWALAGRAVTAASGLGANMLLTRLLSPDEVGAYFLTLSVVAVASMFAQLGLTQTIVRLVAESTATGRDSRAAMAIRLTLGLGAAGVIVAAGFLTLGGGAYLSEHFFQSPLMATVVGLMALMMLILVCQELAAGIFLGFHDIRSSIIFGGSATALLKMLLFAGLWLLQGKSDLQMALVLSVVAGFTSVIFSTFVMRKKVEALATNGDGIDVPEIATIAWPLWVTSIVLLALVQADIWLMGYFASAEEVAIYGAAARVVALIAMPLLLVNSIVPSSIAELNAQGRRPELETILRKAATLVAIPSFIGMAFVLAFGELILRLLFGEHYASGASILIILSAGQMVNVWGGSCGKVLMLTGHQKAMMMITIFCGILAIVLAILLVGPYGGEGVATGAAIGLVLQNVLMVTCAKRMVGIWTHVKPSMALNPRSLF
jgi:O-antigen/teichoic acid export membrane protein